MSTTLRALLWETRPLLAVPDNGLACGMSAELGGTQTERRYAPHDAPMPISINATAALHQLTYQETAMPTRYDYDAHTRAMAGDTIIGTPVSDRLLWRDVLLNIAAGAGICGLLLLALTWIIRGAGL